MQPGNVRRYSMPRSDLAVTAAGVRILPAFALGSWIAFKEASGGAIAMGDLVLREDELNPVVSKLQDGGISQTAIHHHILRENPRTLYMHVHAMGDPVAVARAVRAAVALTGTPPAAPPPSAAPASLGIDTMQINQVIGFAGRTNGGVFQISVPRTETIRDHGVEIPPSMGLGTAINFQPSGGGRAAISGDFVLLGSEVNPVIQALRTGGVEVVSLHNHLLSEEPRLFFMHFWANDDAVKLARVLRSALDRTNSRRAP
jgi:hypothetical protein